MAAQNIKNKIMEILESLKGDGKPLAEVYGYFEPQPKKFPCALVRSTEGQDKKRIDSAHNEVCYSFEIRVLFRTENTLEEEELRMNVFEAIDEAFSKKPNVDTLGGLVHRFDLQGKYFDSQNEQPCTGIYFKAEAFKLKSIF